MTVAAIIGPHLLRRLAPWLVLLVLEAGSQLALKAGTIGLAPPSFAGAWVVDVVSRPMLWLGVFCYIGAFATWMLILARLPLGAAFPASALVFVVVLLGSWLVFHEQIAPLQLVGFALILAGVLLL